MTCLLANLGMISPSAMATPYPSVPVTSTALRKISFFRVLTVMIPACCKRLYSSAAPKLCAPSGCALIVTVTFGGPASGLEQLLVDSDHHLSRFDDRDHNVPLLKV